MNDLDSTQKRNAAKIIAASSFTKLGDILTNPKTVLTWLLVQMGASGAAISMLVPIRESGSMLPQLFVSGWVKCFGRRKKVFVAGALAQALAVAAMGGAALIFSPRVAGPAMVGAVAVFSIARAFCSISSKDVLGRAIPKGTRGRVGGISATISGVISIAAAGWLVVLKDEITAVHLAWIVLSSAALWVIGGGIYGRVDEPPGEKDETSESRDLIGRVSLVKDDPLFRRFILARILLLGSALASPLLVVLSGGEGNAVLSLGGFVIAAGLASASSSFLWGKLSDRGSHHSMALGGLIAALTGGIAVATSAWFPDLAARPFVWPVLFLVFNIGYSGVRSGRKTWVVDVAKGDRRTDYVSSSNTIIAVAILLLGALFAPLQAFSPQIALACYSGLCVTGAMLALSLNPKGDG